MDVMKWMLKIVTVLLFIAMQSIAYADSTCKSGLADFTGEVLYIEDYQANISEQNLVRESFTTLEHISNILKYGDITTVLVDIDGVNREDFSCELKKALLPDVTVTLVTTERFFYYQISSTLVASPTVEEYANQIDLIINFNVMLTEITTSEFKSLSEVNMASSGITDDYMLIVCSSECNTKKDGGGVSGFGSNFSIQFLLRELQKPAAEAPRDDEYKDNIRLDRTYDSSCSIKGQKMGHTDSGPLTQNEADNINQRVSNSLNGAGLLLTGLSLKLNPLISAGAGISLWHLSNQQHYWQAGDRYIQNYWYSQNGKGIVMELTLTGDNGVVSSNKSSYCMEN